MLLRALFYFTYNLKCSSIFILATKGARVGLVGWSFQLKFLENINLNNEHITKVVTMDLRNLLNLDFIQYHLKSKSHSSRCQSPRHHHFQLSNNLARSHHRKNVLRQTRTFFLFFCHFTLNWFIRG